MKICRTGWEPCHYPHFRCFAPKGLRILAGGETAGKPVVIALAPRQWRGTSRQKKRFSALGFASSTPAGVRDVALRVPAVSPPANLHCPFRAISRMLKPVKLWVMTNLLPSPAIRAGGLPADRPVLRGGTGNRLKRPP